MKKYNDIIIKGQHKDRDCHFYLQRIWSYGEDKGWRIAHYGYCNREGEFGESQFFSSYGQAEEHLKELLLTWIAEELGPTNV